MFTESTILQKLWVHVAQKAPSQDLLPIPELLELDEAIAVPPYDATLSFLSVGDFSLEDVRQQDKNENYYSNLRKWIRDVDCCCYHWSYWVRNLSLRPTTEERQVLILNSILRLLQWIFRL